jgi:hypothetical protein
LLLKIHADQDTEDARQKMTDVGLIEPLLWCLKARDVDNRALSEVLEKIARHSESYKAPFAQHANETSESLRSEIIQNGKILAEMLSSHFPTEILRLIVTFQSLSSHSKSSPDYEIQS